MIVFYFGLVFLVKYGKIKVVVNIGGYKVINFIIYEDKEIIRRKYIDIITKFMGRNDVSYKIYQFDNYTKSLKEFIKNNTGYNIYILDIEVPGKSGLDLAREIRLTGDIESQLLVVSAHKELLENTFVNRSLVLNFISKYDNCEENLLSALILAYNYFTRYKAFIFKTEGELYRIPYDDICYFETDTELGTVTLYTKTKTLMVKKTISSILKELNDNRFMKTHKSCIVNLYNIDKVDLSELIIYFNNKKKTNLFSRNYKRELQERLIK